MNHLLLGQSSCLFKHLFVRKDTTTCQAPHGSRSRVSSEVQRVNRAKSVPRVFPSLDLLVIVPKCPKHSTGLAYLHCG